ncbi:MAG: IS3 family transposase [Xanthobacteraceae bacterium]
MTSKTTNKFSPEVRARAVRMVVDHEAEHASRWAATVSIADKIGCTPQTLNEWVKKAEVDSGRRSGVPSDMVDRLKALERENRELRQANEILRKASAYFCPGGARPPVQAMIAFIDDHREAHGIEPICKVLPIAPSTYHAHVARRADPAKRSARAKRDAALKPEVRRVFDDNFQVYGVRKVWRQLRRENHDVARCTVERLMRDLGLQGAIRGKPVRTTVSDKAAPCPLDHVNRQFRAPHPNVLWVSDFTYVATWIGCVYVAFVIDAYARRIVGWRVSRTAHASFVLDALEQALHDRRPIHRGGLVHHSDRGSQYVSIKYTERLAEAGIEPSVGSVGDSYDNALAETINGLYKAEVIHRRGPWRSFEAVEFATLEWVDWFNNRRLLEPIGNIPPAEAEERYYAMLEQSTMAA